MPASVGSRRPRDRWRLSKWGGRLRTQRAAHLLEHVGVGVAALAGLALSLLRDRVTVSEFGSRPGFDGFLVAFGVVVFLVQVPAGAIGAAMVPRLVAADGREAFQSILARLAIFGGVGTLAAATLAEWLAGFLIRDEKSIATASLTLRVLSASVPFMLASVAFTAALQTKGRAGQGAFAAAVRHLAFLGVLLIGATTTESSGWALLLAASLAAVIGECCYLAAIVSLSGWPVIPGLGRAVPNGRLWSESWWLMLNALALGSTNVVDHTMASQFGEGNVSALVYASRVPGAFLAVVSLAVGATLLPRLARTRSAGGDLRRLSMRYLVAMISVGVAAAVSGAFLAPYLHQWLYGNGFGETTESLAAECQVAYWWQVPAYLVVVVNARVIIALGRSLLLLWFGIGIALINVVGNLVLSRWLGAVGIAWSTVLCYSLAALAGFVVVQRLAR